MKQSTSPRNLKTHILQTEFIFCNHTNLGIIEKILQTLQMI